MISEKEKLLNQTYEAFKRLCFGDLPTDKSHDYLYENVMGYGTHIDERIHGIPDFTSLLQLQREASVGLDMKFRESPVFKKVLVHGDSAVFVEEIEISMLVEEKEVQVVVRLTSVLEFSKDTWKVVHWHGSFAHGNKGDEDTWSNNELVEKNKALEKKVAERTQELKVSIENLKATQSQLIQSEKMASLGELTAGIAHEIQNPLNFVNNFSEVNSELIDEMLEELKSGNQEEVIALADDIKDNQQKINHHGKRADAIVKGMLQHSRASSQEKEPVNINALADEYLRLAYHGLRAKDKSFNATLETDFDASLKKVHVVPQDMGRVILNLITNAFYAINEKKNSTKQADYEPTITVRTLNNSGFTEIKIKDNGNGIPQKVKDKIFQPFFTTKPTGEGTGLGLSLSYDIVKAHGGELEVVSEENKGTEFTIKITNKKYN